MKKKPVEKITKKKEAISDMDFFYDLQKFNSNLSYIMKKRRKEMKCTQKQLAEMTKIDLKYLQKVESNKILIEPRLTTLNCIATSLDLSLRTFLVMLLDDRLIAKDEAAGFFLKVRKSTKKNGETPTRRLSDLVKKKNVKK